MVGLDRPPLLFPYGIPLKFGSLVEKYVPPFEYCSLEMAGKLFSGIARKPWPYLTQPDQKLGHRSNLWPHWRFWHID